MQLGLVGSCKQSQQFQLDPAYRIRYFQTLTMITRKSCEVLMHHITILEPEICVATAT